MPQTNIFSYCIKILFFLQIQFLFFGCNQNNESNITDKNIQSDSVRHWLKQSKLRETTSSEKTNLLQKAYTYISQIENDTLKTEFLVQLSYQYAFSNDTTSFKNINEEGIELAHTIKDSNSLATLNWDLGDFYKKNNKQDSAYYYYAKSEKIFTNIRQPDMSGRLLINMVGIQSNIGDYTGAEITAIKALEKLKPLNAYSQLYYCYNELADLSKMLNEYDRALSYYNESLIYIKKANKSPLVQIGNKNNIGLVYQKKGDYKKAIEHFSDVLNFDSIHIKNPRLYGRALNNLGSSLLKSGNTNQLPDLFIKAITIQDSINDLRGKTSSTHRLAEYYLFKRDTLRALHNLQLAKSFAIQNSDNKKLLEILRMFPEVDPIKATQYTQQYISLNDSLQSIERKIRDKFARVRFETDTFIAENHTLSKQKQLWSGVAITLLLLGLATFIIITQRNKNKILKFKQQQQANNQEIFNLLLAQNEKVEEGKKSEQKRVSEELHDGVLGRMLGARMMLIGLNKKTTDEAISERAKAISILQDVEGEIRSISHELSHAAYQKIHNFILSIQDLLKTVETASKIEIDFSYAENLDWDALSGDIKINLYRMIQENIQNAVKHADCKNIDLKFETDAQFLHVTIADNGKGFIKKKGRKGIGMRNIASRMQKINGTWKIDSAIGKGTTVHLNIPVVANDGSSHIGITSED